MFHTFKELGLNVTYDFNNSRVKAVEAVNLDYEVLIEDDPLSSLKIKGVPLTCPAPNSML